jgi:hypothetical protein
MNPDRQQLLHDLLEGDPNAGRDATLLAGARILRRRRQWRAATRGLAGVLVLVAAGLWLKTAPAPKATRPTPLLATAPQAPVKAAPRSLTDEELLALFPNTPVALATLPDGRKRLFFPHPGDEEKYVIHL